jgi:phosphate acetyltransferase
MIRSIFISSAEPYSGKTLISIGLFEAILRKTKKVAFFKPIIRERADNDKDKSIELLLDHYKLKQKYEDSFVFYREEAQNLLGVGKQDEFLDRIIKKFKKLEEDNDFVICEGSDYVGEGSYFEFDINALIAKNLGLPIFVIGQGLGRNINEIINPIQLALDAFLHQDSNVIGVVVNRVMPERREEILKAMKKRLPKEAGFFSVIPTNEILSSPTVREVAQQLNAKVLYGKDKMDHLVTCFQSVAMQLGNYFKYVQPGSIAITPGDRDDILMGALQINQSRNYPNISGIILTGGIKPKGKIKKLLDGIPDVLPILSVKEFTFETSVNAGNVVSTIDKKSANKIQISQMLFEKFVDFKALEEKVMSTLPSGLTPKMFIYHLQKLASQDRKRIVLPEGSDDRILRAVDILQKKDVVDLIILGEPESVKARARALGLHIDFDKTPVIDTFNSAKSGKYAKTLFELRKNKGVNMEIAADLMTDVSYFGTMMVYLGDADGMVSGAAHTTQHTIRPALQFIKTKPGYNVVSSVFFMCLDDRVVAYGDCAINPNPTAEELAEIAIASAETTQRFNIEPKVAMLSYSSGDSGKGAEVEKVRAATKIVHEKRPKLKVEGPIQYDAAVDMAVGKSKLPNSEVAGQASVLIFPDLNTGNNTYKAVQRETGAIAIGPVLQGLNKPVNDLSRGCTVEDIVNTVIITAIQAQEKKSK